VGARDRIKLGGLSWDGLYGVPGKGARAIEQQKESLGEREKKGKKNDMSPLETKTHCMGEQTPGNLWGGEGERRKRIYQKVSNIKIPPTGESRKTWGGIVENRKGKAHNKKKK